MATARHLPTSGGVYRKQVLVDVTVPASQNWVVLNVAASETPTETAAVGAVTTAGAVVAFHTGTFGSTHALDLVSGINALRPKNLCLVRDAVDSKILKAGGKTIYALIQSEVATDGHTINDTTQQVQLSFVIENTTGTAFIACPVEEIAGKSINYAYPVRTAAFPEDALIDGEFAEPQVWDRFEKTTTDATATTAWTSPALSMWTHYYLEFTVTAISAGGAIRNQYKRCVTAFMGDQVVAIGTVQTLAIFESETTPDVTFTTSGNTVRVTITGKASTTITWRGEVTIKMTASAGTTVESNTVFGFTFPGSGASYLPLTSALNDGTPITAAGRFRGQDASGSGWTYNLAGANLTLTGSGSNPLYQEEAPFTDGTAGVYFTGGKYFQATDNTFLDVANDFAFHLFCTVPPAASLPCVVVAKRNAAQGWEAGFNASSKFYVRTHGSGQNYLYTSTNAHAAGQWLAITFIQDLSAANRSALFIGGEPDWTGGGAGNPLTKTNSEYFTIGADSAGNSKYTGIVAIFQMWVDTHVSYQPNLVPGELMPVWGLKPTYAAGTARPYQDGFPDFGVFGRAGDEALIIYNSTTGIGRIFHVGDHYYKMEQWQAQSDLAYYRGYVASHAVTNLCTYNKDMSGAAWTAINATNALDDTRGPDDDSYFNTADALLTSDDTTNSQHGWRQNCSLTAATYTFSIFAKAGARNFLYLADNTIANGWAFFNLSTGVVGTKGAGITNSRIRNFGNGWYRCEIQFTGTAAPHTLAIYASTTDTGAANPAFLGDGITQELYVTLAQVEQVAFATHPIVTGSGTVARAADALYYNGADGNIGSIGSANRGVTYLEYLAYQSNTQGEPGGTNWFNIGNSAGTDRFEQQISGDKQQYYVNTIAGGNSVNQFGKGSALHADTPRQLLTRFDATDMTSYENGGTTLFTDATVAMPASVPWITIGHEYSGNTRQPYSVMICALRFINVGTY